MSERRFSRALRAALASVLLLCFAGAASAWVNGDTKTKYPIVLVPGVMGFDALFGSVEYFYKVADGIRDYSGGQKTYNVSLSAWMSTEERGIALKNEIVRILKAHYGVTTLTSAHKVNIIAHSHGSTTSRVAAKLIQDNIASLTTVAGPHYGTPMPDYAITLPKPVLMTAIAGLNVAGSVVSVFSGRLDWLFQQNAGGVMNDFTQAGMQRFNTLYPSAGLPAGASYGRKQYGADAVALGKPAGDGQGAEKSVSDPNAILFYSFTGNTHNDTFTAPGFPLITDPVDWALLVTRKFGNWYGYSADSDSFVPVSSARFGKTISSSYWWNHCDEQNQTLGLLGWGAADPITVYRAHANRLMLAGR
jgi:triacylglycerol lipase